MTEELAEKKCIPCHGGVPTLTDTESQYLLGKLEGWSIANSDGVDRLVKNYKTSDFAGAMKLANAVANVAEAEGHHPDLLVSWGALKITLWTHAINGLSESDFILAAKIDRL
jgi:4a-hydroxytetrahydrobiopterin dehydratase